VADECLTCLAVSGERRISPGSPIYEGRYWVVEHANPTALLGWLVVVLKRHAQGLHELSLEEWAEQAALIGAATRTLRRLTGCVKEYAACLAEAPGHQHIHFHVVPRAGDLPESLRGTGIFAMLKVSAAEAVAPAMVADFCEEARSVFGEYVRAQ
jgi:diadenosine tetraphosphate (Ap4A) HIT family hydrolase